MPARSKAQYDYMKAVCNGNMKSDMPKEQACEYVQGQDRSKLPKKVKSKK